MDQQRTKGILTLKLIQIHYFNFDQVVRVATYLSNFKDCLWGLAFKEESNFQIFI